MDDNPNYRCLKGVWINMATGKEWHQSPWFKQYFRCLNFCRREDAHEQWLFLMWWGLRSFCSTIELHPRALHSTRD
jgi:hypothetical protein